MSTLPEQTFLLWPQAITDRPPTEEDADRLGNVQYLDDEGWNVGSWTLVAKDNDPWLHTPYWKPWVHREKAIASLKEIIQYGSGCELANQAQIALDYIEQLEREDT